MKKHDRNYLYAKSFLKDKDRYINTFVDTYIDKMQSAFVYSGLPDTIPKEELERLLMVEGDCFITEVRGDLYALSGNAGGEGDAYNRPTLYTVANAWLDLSATYTIGADGVLCKNDYRALGLLPLLFKNGALLCDTEITVNLMTILHRMNYMISAPDDKTKASADLFMQKIFDGDYSIIAENSFFDGVKLQAPPTGNGTYITQYIELLQYQKASMLNELGLNANFNMKRETLNDGEIALNVDAILPFIDNMYTERLKAMDMVNKMFGTDIKVDFASAWKTLREEREKATEQAQSEVITIEEEELTSLPDEAETMPDEAETMPNEEETMPDEAETEQDVADEEEDKK